LWTALDKVSGAQCLIAWENVCQPKEDGGLGIRCLNTQNASLLLKLIHRLHHPDGSAWATWVRGQIHMDSLQGDLAGTHWEALRNLLPAYQHITRVNIRDGRSTDFWKDTWLDEAPLATCLPALHSHFAGHGTSVQEVLSAPLRSQLQRCLSSRAAEELEKLTMMLQDIVLSNALMTGYASLRMATRSCLQE
jgi:hypothetical protein